MHFVNLFDSLQTFQQMKSKPSSPMHCNFTGSSISYCAGSREDMLVVMPGKQLPSKPPPSHGFNRPIEKSSLVAASPSDALGLLMQNHDFAASIKSYTHACTAELIANVIQHVSASNAEQPSSPKSPMRRNSQASRSTMTRSPLRSSTRTSAALSPPPAASHTSHVMDTPAPSKAPPSRLSPPPSRNGNTAARSPSPSSRVSFGAATSTRARRSSSAVEPITSNSPPCR
jgi:hypothetical protein